MHIRVRTATVEDIESIVGFNLAMARETEEKDLDEDRLRRGVRGVFDEPHRGVYLVAEAGGRLVGGLLVTYEWSDWRNGDFWWIQSVYVEPDFRRQGVFRAMYVRVVEEASGRDGICGVRLYVERENTRAQAVYEALGMTRSRYLLLESRMRYLARSLETPPS